MKTSMARQSTHQVYAQWEGNFADSPRAATWKFWWNKTVGTLQDIKIKEYWYLSTVLNLSLWAMTLREHPKHPNRSCAICANARARTPLGELLLSSVCCTLNYPPLANFPPSAEKRWARFKHPILKELSGGSVKILSVTLDLPAGFLSYLL